MVIKFLLGQGIYVTKPLLFFQKGSGTRLASKPLIAPTLFDHAHSFHFELHNTVADLEIQKGGFSHWRAKPARKFLGCHAHFRSRWKSELNISKQLWA